jgi:hypothetical protein
MKNSLEISNTLKHNLSEIMGIYSFARSFMDDSGNPNQWLNGYPQEEIILSDIIAKQHFVCKNNRRIIGCFALIEGNDPTYKKIVDGTWKNNLPYATLHRLAVLEPGKEVGTFCVKWCLSQYQNIRADTHEKNIPLQRLLKKCGFEYCGKIFNRWGDPRLAYQKYIQ